MTAGRRRFLLAVMVAGLAAVAGCAGPRHRDGPHASGRAPDGPRLEADALPAADLSAAATARLLRGDPGGAAALYERAVGREEAGGDRARLAVDLSSLALAYDMLDRRDEAGRTYRRALPLLEETLGPDHPRTALARRNLALMTPGPSDARDGGDAVPVAAAATASGAGGSAAAGPALDPAARGTAGGGRFAVQLAAVRERSGVTAEWRRLTTRHPALAGLEPRPAQAVGTGSGTLYRVTGGSFATEAEARSVCERVRAEGDGCRVMAF